MLFKVTVKQRGTKRGDSFAIRWDPTKGNLYDKLERALCERNPKFRGIDGSVSRTKTRDDGIVAACFVDRGKELYTPEVLYIYFDSTNNEYLMEQLGLL